MQYAHAYTTQQERMISGAFASVMHLLFIALLVFGVNWQKKVEPQVNIVDLWSPPSEVQPRPVEPRPEPPKPEIKPQVQPKVEPTPPKAVAKPEVAKPDIALKEKEKEKEKAEKERRIVEDKQKEAKKREDAAKAAQKAQQAEAQRLANEQAEAQRVVAAQAASAQAKMRSEYIGRIRDKIKRFIVKPPNLKGNEESEFDVVVLPDGNVLGAKLKRASGNAAYDGAVERAINRAQPFPMPPDPALLKDFRELNLKFSAQE
jgi:colicin import membrane protein